MFVRIWSIGLCEKNWLCDMIGNLHARGRSGRNSGVSGTVQLLCLVLANYRSLRERLCPSRFSLCLHHTLEEWSKGRR